MWIPDDDVYRQVDECRYDGCRGKDGHLLVAFSGAKRTMEMSASPQLVKLSRKQESLPKEPTTPRQDPISKLCSRAFGFDLAESCDPARLVESQSLKQTNHRVQLKPKNSLPSVQEMPDFCEPFLITSSLHGCEREWTTGKPGSFPATDETIRKPSRFR